MVRVLFVSDTACGASGKDSERLDSREWAQKGDEVRVKRKVEGKPCDFAIRLL